MILQNVFMETMQCKAPNFGGTSRLICQDGSYLYTKVGCVNIQEPRQ